MQRLFGKEPLHRNPLVSGYVSCCKGNFCLAVYLYVDFFIYFCMYKLIIIYNPYIMKARQLLYFFISIILLLPIASCSPESDDEKTTGQTVVMFFPWSTNLQSDFKRNIREFSSVIARCGLNGERVVVCFATSHNTAVVYELKPSHGRCLADTLRRYYNRTFTTRSSLASLFSDIKSLAPAERYGMVLGSHGMAWLPVDDSSRMRRIARHYDKGGLLKTRYMGGLTSDCQIETSNFAGALQDAGLTLEYLLFDNCYMSSVEVAYELKDVVQYMIASPTEIMSEGFPYSECGEFLLGNFDCTKVAEKFVDYYSRSDQPYATVAVIDLSQMDALAQIVKKINEQCGENVVAQNDIQTMDGYTPSLFLDFGHYITLKCTSSELIDSFEQQLDKTVIFKAHTEKYFSAMCGSVPIAHYSGLNTSEPSKNPLSSAYSHTAWYAATHQK